MTDYHNPAWTKESRFRGSLDDVIIIPLVVVALAANKILAFHPFNPDAAARLRLPFGNADRLASALRGQCSWQCHRDCHKRRVASCSPFRDGSSALEHIDPPELVVASTEDWLSGVRTSCAHCP